MKSNKEILINSMIKSFNILVSIHQEDIDEIIDDIKVNRDEKPYFN